MDPDGRGWGGTEKNGGETVNREYCLRKKVIFNNREKRKRKEKKYSIVYTFRLGKKRSHQEAKQRMLHKRNTEFLKGIRKGTSNDLGTDISSLFKKKC